MRRADARFLLPQHPATALVLGVEPHWAEALAATGIREIRPDQIRPGEVPDLVVAEPTRASEALAIGAPFVLIEGASDTRSARAAGYRVARYLVLPDVTHPEMIVPAAHHHARAHALAFRGSRKSAIRKLQYQLTGLAAALAPRRVWPEAQLVLASRDGVTPAVLRAAAPLGVEPNPGWFLVLGRYASDPGARLAFLAGSRRGRPPRWAVKVSRTRGMTTPFERDEKAAALLRSAAPDLADVAPALLGRSTVDDHPFSVETAAVGPRLGDSLRRTGTSTLPLVQAISTWTIDLAVRTRLGSDALRAARIDLSSTLAAWGGEIDAGSLLDALGDDVPAVLAHGDLGSWNIICTGSGFQIVDWETAVRAAPPLFDLVFFLGDACSTMVRRPQDPDYLADLFAGRTDLSPFVFEQIDAAAAALNLSKDDVGRLAALTWLWRGAIARPQYGDGHHLVRFARHWMADAALGAGWSTERGATRG